MEPVIKEKLTHETTAEYALRVCINKELWKLTWKEVANLINKNCNLSYSESWYRRNFKDRFFNVAKFNVNNNSEEDIVDEPIHNINETPEQFDDLAARQEKLNQTLYNINIRRAEVADLVAQNNAYIRRMSREQTIKEIAHDYALIMSDAKPMIPHLPINNTNTEKEGILLISDWHYGLICDNAWNEFNPQICRQRIAKLLDDTIDLIEQNELTHLTVLDLSDLIAGRIHTQIRIESRFDVITQTMDVAEILAEFLDELSWHCGISFYSCLDNHSRIEPNKKESLDLESLTRIIPWYLTERLTDNSCVDICHNEYGEDIITCEVLGHPIIAVHGHNDSPVNAIEKLSMLTRNHYDMLCMAHRHHIFLEEQFESFVVSNGCLVGVDNHSKNMRLTSKPSQTFIVVTKEDVCSSIHRILLNNV